MNRIVRTLASRFVKALPLVSIIGKKMKGLDKRLYFQPSQHLTFLLKREIAYESNVQQRIKAYIKAGDTVFDIGGNIGQYALLFSELVGDSGRVHSFEPDIQNFAFLQFNGAINKCRNLSCHNCGVGAADAELEFFRDTETGGRMGSFIKEYVGTNYRGHKEVVRLREFDSLVGELGAPDFIKIDVEGFELNVLNGLTIMLEDSLFLVEVRQETKQPVYQYFADKGFNCLWIDYEPRLINDPAELPDFANLLFSKTQFK